MQVILLENVRNLGALGDTVNVKAGYGRNYLIPQGKAVTANAENLADFQNRKAEFEKKAKAVLTEAEKRAEAVVKLASIEVSVLASEEGKLYGSVGPNEIADALEASDVAISRKEIVMPEGPIHEIGEHEVECHLHSDVVVTLMVHVVSA